MHGKTYHGGFNLHDHVDVFLHGEWSDVPYVIDKFDGISVLLGAKDGSHSIAATIYEIRHHHLAKEVAKSHGSRA